MLMKLFGRKMTAAKVFEKHYLEEFKKQFPYLKIRSSSIINTQSETSQKVTFDVTFEDGAVIKIGDILYSQYSSTFCLDSDVSRETEVNFYILHRNSNTDTALQNRTNVTSVPLFVVYDNNWSQVTEILQPGDTCNYDFLINKTFHIREVNQNSFELGWEMSLSDQMRVTLISSDFVPIYQ
jgi:hypothetical protein